MLLLPWHDTISGAVFFYICCFNTTPKIALFVCWWQNLPILSMGGAAVAATGAYLHASRYQIRWIFGKSKKPSKIRSFWHQRISGSSFRCQDIVRWNFAEILSPTDEPTDKAILGVGFWMIILTFLSGGESQFGLLEYFEWLFWQFYLGEDLNLDY